MRKAELHCLMVGKSFRDYPGLANMLRHLDVHLDFKEINATGRSIKSALKKLQGASLVFVPQSLFSQRQRPDSQSADSLQIITDLIWQYACEAIIVVLDDEPVDSARGQSHLNRTRGFSSSVSSVISVNDVQISYLRFSPDQNAFENDHNDHVANSETRLRLQFLMQMALLKYDFRRCKRLLGISEKRCQWLVDSSKAPIAFICRDLHLYANRPYLELFGIDTVQTLRTKAVKDLINDEEHDVFDNFMRSQLIHPNQNQSLMIRMKNNDGKIIKSNIRLIPAVYRGKRCLQLWVRSLSEMPEEKTEIEKIWNQKESKTVSAYPTKHSQLQEQRYSIMQDKKVDADPVSNSQQEEISPALILKEIIKRKEARLFTRKLLDLNHFALEKPPKKDLGGLDDYYIVSLHVPFAQRRAVDDLLSKTSYQDLNTLRSLFWDKVKMTRLFQILAKKKLQNIKLLVRLSEASIRYKKQVIWLQQGLKKTGIKSSMILFLLPSRLDESGQRDCVTFIKRLTPYGCQFVLDDFFITPESLMLLKHAKPQAVRFYLPWIQQIEGNEKREIALSRLIRKLESRGIKVIAPCGYSQSMKKLFLFAGASFCQEKTSMSD